MPADHDNAPKTPASAHAAQALQEQVSKLTAELAKFSTVALPSEAQTLLQTCEALCRSVSVLAAATAGSSADAAAAIAAGVQALPVAASAGPAPAVKITTVIVIDDDEDIQRMVRFLLPKKGPFQVVSFTSPVQALAHLTTLEPDAGTVVLMDLMMPEMTGFELLPKIRALPAMSEMKIIVGSSRSYDKDRIAVLQAGANEFIAKPYNFNELVLRLGRLAG